MVTLLRVSTLKILDHSINNHLLACDWRKEKYAVSVHAAELSVHDSSAGPDLAWWPEGPWSPDRGWTCCPHASPRCELGGPGPSPHPPPPLLPLGVPGTSRSLGTHYWTEHQHASLLQHQPFIPPSLNPSAILYKFHFLVLITGTEHQRASLLQKISFSIHQ